MGGIALMFVGAAIFLFVAGLLIVRYAQFVLTRLVERKHMAAEIIIQSGTVPPWWKRGAARIPAGYAKLRAISRLRSVIRYFRTTPMVEDEATRRRIIAALEETLDRWKSLSWSEMLDQRIW